MGKRRSYKVLPFGSTNKPSFYTAMMHYLGMKWLLLYSDTKHLIHLDSTTITIICNDKIIIDDILLYSNNVNTLIRYFSCVVQVFTKYRLFFKLIKCEFFKPRVEFVGHDLTTYGNFPVASKFDLIKHWLFYYTLYPCCLLLDCVVSTADIVLGLRRMQNHSVNLSVNIIVNRFQSFLGIPL